MTSHIERGPFGKVLSFMGAEYDLEDFAQIDVTDQMVDNLRKRLAEPDCPHGLPWNVCMKCGSDYA